MYKDGTEVKKVVCKLYEDEKLAYAGGTSNPKHHYQVKCIEAHKKLLMDLRVAENQ